MTHEDSRRLAYVAIARKAYESHPFWLEKRVFSRWEAWEDLIQLASFAPHTWAIPRGSVLQLQRGETKPLSRSFLANRWCWSQNKVWRFLGLLQNMAQIQTGQRTTQGATYLLVNYDFYQGGQTGDGSENQQAVDRRQTGGRQKDKQGKQGKHGKQTTLGENETDVGAMSTDLVPTRDRAVSAKSIAESLERMGEIEVAKKDFLGLQIQVVFAYWVKKFGKDNARTMLSHGRWARLKKYISQYGIETCLYAIDGADTHPHMNHDDGRVFHGFEEIFMNKPDGPGRVEKLSDFARQKDKQPKHLYLAGHPGLEKEI